MRLSTIANAHGQALMRALAQMRAQPLSTALSVFVIGVAMMLPLMFHVLYQNLAAGLSRVNTDPQVNVYLAVAASSDDARAAETRIRALANVKSVRFVHRDAALADLKKTGRMNDLLSGIDGNPLPHAFVVTPTSLEAEPMAALRKELAATPKVEVVTMEFEWARKLTRIATFLQAAGYALALMLGVAVVFVTGNTIRLQILSKRDEIIVSRLIGATRRFVRRPFLYFGAIQGVAAAVIALLLATLFTWWGGSEVRAFAAGYGAVVNMSLPSLATQSVVLAVGALLGWLGAIASVALFWRSGTVE